MYQISMMFYYMVFREMAEWLLGLKKEKKCLFALFWPTQKTGNKGSTFFVCFDSQFCILKQNVNLKCRIYILYII